MNFLYDDLRQKKVAFIKHTNIRNYYKYYIEVTALIG